MILKLFKFRVLM